MKNRVPTYPGRVQLTPVSGDIYDLTRADEPTEVGTPMSKATFLSDSAASVLTSAGATFGLDPLVSEALEFLGGVTGNNGVQVELVSYVGTGVYGASNPTEITFSFDPDVVIMLTKTPTSGSYNDFLGQTQYGCRVTLPISILTSSYSRSDALWYNSSPTNNYGKYDTGTHTLSFYTTGSSADATKQYNSSGDTYYIIGLRGFLS